MSPYYIRLDAAAAGPQGGAPLEVAVDETAGGVRVAMGSTGHWRHVDLAEVVPGWYSVVIDGQSHTVCVATWRTGSAGHRAGGVGPRQWTLVFDGEAVTADITRSTRGRASAQAAAGAAAGQVRAPMPGLVVAIHAEPGTAVAAGQPLIIMEAMKMQMEIRAPHAGIVRDIRVVPGQDVAGNDVLATVE